MSRMDGRGVTCLLTLCLHFFTGWIGHDGLLLGLDMVRVNGERVGAWSAYVIVD